MTTKKTETVKARFQEAIDEYKRLRDVDYATPLEKFLNEPISKTDRDRVQKSFLEGLKKRFSPESDYSLKLAFEAADLDPQDLLDREVLLRLFVSAHFPRQKTRGAKTKWTPERWSQLLSDYDQVRKDSRNLNDTEICKKIIKRFSMRYFKQSPGTLRRNLASARDPLKNTKVAELAEEFAIVMKAELHTLDPDLEFSAQKIKRQSELFVIEWLSKAWERERN